MDHSLITFSIGFRPSIFVGDHSLAHQILIQNGAVFSYSHYPPTQHLLRFLRSTWRLLRRNLASEVLHSSRVKSYSWARNWVLQILINRLQDRKAAAGIQVVDRFQFAMFSLLVLMCFGQKLNEEQIKEIARVPEGEIVSVVGPPPPPGESTINEEDLQKTAYLKAVVLEGLRRHPPAHFVLPPHRVSKEVVGGHVIPEGATINFFVADMGWDPKVWDAPMEFKPERFLTNDDVINGVFDVSGSKGIKMMPFGAGRRMCPGSDLALLHLEYFVANLIWFFRWNVVDGYEFTVVMKNPLRTQIVPRA